ncbi:MAG: nitroreductase family protein [Acutalibacteraceae bacterium]
MDFLKIAHERFSVLEYSERIVEQEKINKIIEAGLAAPTACNFQPQRILIIDNDEGRQKLNRVAASKYYIPAAFLVCYNKQECWTRPMDGKSSGDIDASIVTTHMMLEATQLGLGSIWVMYWDPEKMKAEFEIDDTLEPVALLIVGYKSEKATPRAGHLKSKSKEDILIK